MLAAWRGEDDVSANVAPTALYIALWIGMQVASAVLGDVWRRINPLWTIAAGLDRIRGRDSERSPATGWWGAHWPAALGRLRSEERREGKEWVSKCSTWWCRNNMKKKHNKT